MSAAADFLLTVRSTKAVPGVPTPPLSWVELLGHYSRWTYWKEQTERIFRSTRRKSTEAGTVPAHLRKLSADEIGQLAEQYQAGATTYELARSFNIHRTTVSSHLLRAGIAIRRPGLSKEQVVAAAKLYGQGWPLAKLGNRFGVSADTVGLALKRTGVQMRKSWERG